MKRLVATEVAAYRNAKLREQGMVCLLCQATIGIKDAVLDHDHTTGHCRGVLHRGCNSMLGKIENNRCIAQLSDKDLLNTFLSNVGEYLERSTGVLHNTHKTDEEKRIRRNKKARINRAKSATKDADS